jgi:N-acyl amino acid synthase of PEP-CTERM/exosortase system
MSVEVPPFSVQIANTNDAQKAVYRLRYQVYCLESQFEDPNNYPDAMEKDHFDQQAIHILVTHTDSGMSVGTLRLIFARNNQQPFHFEQLSHQCFSHIHKKPRSHYVELSRLAVPQAFRNNKANSINANEDGELLALMLICNTCMVITRALNIEVVALLETRLAILLRRNGIGINKIGDVINHNGYRAPYLLDFNQRFSSLKSKELALYNTIENQLKKDVLAHPIVQSQRQASMELTTGH